MDSTSITKPAENIIAQVPIPLTWKEKIKLMAVGDSHDVGKASRSTIMNTANELYGDDRMFTTRKMPDGSLRFFRLPDPVKTKESNG